MAKEKEIDKDKMLDQVLADIEKQFGKGAIMRLGGSETRDSNIRSRNDICIYVGRITSFSGTFSRNNSFIERR